MNRFLLSSSFTPSQFDLSRVELNQVKSNRCLEAANGRKNKRRAARVTWTSHDCQLNKWPIVGTRQAATTTIIMRLWRACASTSWRRRVLAPLLLVASRRSSSSSRARAKQNNSTSTCSQQQQLAVVAGRPVTVFFFCGARAGASLAATASGRVDLWTTTAADKFSSSSDCDRDVFVRRHF